MDLLNIQNNFLMINNGNTLLKIVPFSPLYADDLQSASKVL
jgi:hypothetical protein